MRNNKLLKEITSSRLGDSVDDPDMQDTIIKFYENNVTIESGDNWVHLLYDQLDCLFETYSGLRERKKIIHDRP